MEPITIKGRTYTVERKAAKNSEDESHYILVGSRGARYYTMRNKVTPDLMFIVREGAFNSARTIGGGLEGVWLSDKSGTLRVVG
jgi:hypothetical protein